MKKLIGALVALLAIVTLSGCTDSDVASRNISNDADNFKVLRKITFINTVTGEVLYTIEGNMSIQADTEDNQLEITAKTGKDQFQKHIIGLSPTTVYIVQQQKWQTANQYRFKITWKPSTIVPDVEIR